MESDPTQQEKVAKLARLRDLMRRIEDPHDENLDNPLRKVVDAAGWAGGNLYILGSVFDNSDSTESMERLLGALEEIYDSLESFPKREEIFPSS